MSDGGTCSSSSTRIRGIVHARCSQRHAHPHRRRVQRAVLIVWSLLDKSCVYLRQFAEHADGLYFSPNGKLVVRVLEGECKDFYPSSRAPRGPPRRGSRWRRPTWRTPRGRPTAPPSPSGTPRPSTRCIYRPRRYQTGSLQAFIERRGPRGFDAPRGVPEAVYSPRVRSTSAFGCSRTCRGGCSRSCRTRTPSCFPRRVAVYRGGGGGRRAFADSPIPVCYSTATAKTMTTTTTTRTRTTPGRRTTPPGVTADGANRRGGRTFGTGTRRAFG